MKKLNKLDKDKVDAALVRMSAEKWERIADALEENPDAWDVWAFTKGETCPLCALYGGDASPYISKGIHAHGCEQCPIYQEDGRACDEESWDENDEPQEDQRWPGMEPSPKEARKFADFLDDLAFKLESRKS